MDLLLTIAGLLYCAAALMVWVAWVMNGLASELRASHERAAREIAADRDALESRIANGCRRPDPMK